MQRHGWTAPLFSSLLNYRHGAADLGTEFGTAGVELLEAQSWTNYPIMRCVDELGDGFSLRADVDRRINPQRIVEYMQVVLRSLLFALEQVPMTPASTLSLLPETERRETLESFNSTAARPAKKADTRVVRGAGRADARRGCTAIFRAGAHVC